jgi:twitching motility protein PilJ
MAFKLPFIAKSKAEPATEADAMAMAGGGMAFPGGLEASTAPSTAADTTRIGNALARAGDVRLPVLGNYPLQQQVRILLAVLGGSLVLGGRHGVAEQRLVHNQRHPNANRGRCADALAACW